VSGATLSFSGSVGNPSFSILYTGFANGENSSVIDTLATASSPAILTSPAGLYAIIASGAFDNNYDFNYIDGVLTINGVPAPVFSTDHLPASVERAILEIILPKINEASTAAPIRTPQPSSPVSSQILMSSTANQSNLSTNLSAPVQPTNQSPEQQEAEADAQQTEQLFIDPSSFEYSMGDNFIYYSNSVRQFYQANRL
jgi:hypothetical protein